MIVRLPRDRVFPAIRKAARATGVRVYLVGGPLRDILLGRPLVDLDIAVEGSPRPLGTRLGRELHGTFTYHPEFGTGTLFLPDGPDGTRAGPSADRAGRHIDLARARTETYSRPAALPDVRFADIATDLRRRDFTINALACDLTRCELIDPNSGAEDLRNGVIRILHGQSFRDDPTRIFRAIRFSCRLGFTIEPTTSRLIDAAIHERLICRLSGTRVLNELRLAMREDRALAMLRELNRRGVFTAIFGRRLADSGLNRLARLSAADTYLRLAYLAALLHDNSPIPFTHDEQADIDGLRAWPKLRPRLAAARRPSRILQVLSRQPRNALVVQAQLENGTIATKIRNYLDDYSQVETLLTGRDLNALGLEPGPLYGVLLERLRNWRLDKGVLTRKQELELLKKWTNEE